ncbi:MAG: PilC/PilY family type IV pilus protein, partial [Desulfobacterales bacterium]
HIIFRRIVDGTERLDGGDGIFDEDYGNRQFPTSSETALAAYDDGTGTLFTVDRDRQVTPRDMKKHLGRFAAGSEVVFFLTAGSKWDLAEASQVFFNKPWGPDHYDACVPDSGSPRWIDEGNRIFEKVFHLGDPAAAGICETETNWLDARLIDRLGAHFDLHLSGESLLKISVGAPYPHLIGGNPADDSNQTVLGFEDKNVSTGGADMDFNDLLFLVERLNGGTALLDPAKAITLDEENARFTTVEVLVCDVQPADSCAGRTALSYFVSPDHGANWVEVIAWDSVRSFELDTEGAIISGNEIDPDKWTPGVPTSTCRKRSIDLLDRGVTGNRLLWKVEMISMKADCAPEVIDVQLKAHAAINKMVSRASPVIQSNIIYAVADETPADSWVDQTLRGHVTARRIYDPIEPDHTLREQEPLWDAGEVLRAMNPDERKIFFPDLDVQCVKDEYLTDENGQRLQGDGARTTFTGFLAHSPVQATTLRIYDGRPEVFIDSGASILKGSLGGKGLVDRFAGRWEVTFNRPPAAGVPIMASYSWYTADHVLKAFVSANVTNDMLALSDEYIWPDGYTHDVNRDGHFDVTEEQTDAAGLVRWVRGFRQPETGVKKDWLLGPVNHSVPALMVPPGYPRWLHGTRVTEAERDRFADFQKAHQTRHSVLFVGSGGGMLHAFDAGAFRHGDNPDTPGIEENRGYFLWKEKNETSPHYCEDYEGAKCPDYGTGRELWAFIPASQIPRIKNNLLSARDRAQINTPPAISDVYVDTNGDGFADSWRTIVIGASGNGGDGVFCLDVTDPNRPTFLWEFSVIDLFRDPDAQAVAQIGRILDPLTGEPKWTAFIATGKMVGNDNYPSVYLIDISDGTLIKRVTLAEDLDLNGDGSLAADETGYRRGSNLSGPPAMVDSDDNGFVDRLYIGSNGGLVYKINLPDDPKTPDTLTHCVLNTDFTDTDGNQIPMEQRQNGIYATPTVVVENTIIDAGKLDSRVRIVFGTGESPHEYRKMDTPGTRNVIFSYVDTAAIGECNPSKHELDWFYELNENQKVRAPIAAAAGRLYVGTTTNEVEDQCEALRTENSDLGLLTVMDLEGVVYLSRRIGNVHFAPLVEDQHIYLTTPTGLLSLGSGIYNNELLSSFGVPMVNARSWEEVD